MTVRLFLLIVPMLVIFLGCNSSPVSDTASEVKQEASNLEAGQSGANEGVNAELAAEELSDDMDAESSKKQAPSAGAAEETAPAKSASTAEEIELDLGADAVEPKENVATSEETPSKATTDIATPSLQKPVDVTNIRYLANKNGGTLQVNTSAPATFRTRQGASANQLVLEIADAHLPKRLMRPLITKNFNQAITAITAYQDSGSTTARIVVQFRGAASANTNQEGEIITLAPSNAPAPAAPQRSTEVLASSNEFDDNTIEEVDQEAAKSKADGQSNDQAIDKLTYESTRFYGRQINIEVREMPVRDAIALIAEYSGANIVVADEVSGNVSLKLRKVPWDQALMIVMKSKKLGYVRQGRVLRIASLDVLQKESEAARLILESQRMSEPLKVRMIPINYAVARDLATKVKDFLSPRGKAVADDRTSSLIITDILEHVERASNLVKALDTPPLQVLIEAKIVDAAETFLRNFGINWGYSGIQQNLGGSINLNQNLNINPSVQTGNLGFNLAVGQFDILGDITAALSLAERESNTKVLSSPRVVTLNNSMADISENTKVRVLPDSTTVSSSGNLTLPPPTFVDVKLSLKVTPSITPDGDVTMAINLTRGIPVGISGSGEISERQANTLVMVHNGQTAVLGGIYSMTEIVEDTGVPFLKNIPILGYLFKNKTRSKDKNELVLFVTPTILQDEKSKAKAADL